MSLSVWVLLNFLEAKGLCLFFTKYFVKPSNKSCQQSKVKQKKKEKKKRLPGSPVCLFAFQNLASQKCSDGLCFVLSQRQGKKLTTTEVKPWIMSNCGKCTCFYLCSFVPHDLTWLELTLRHASTSRHFTSGNYVLSLFYSSLKTPKQTSWYQFVDFYE